MREDWINRCHAGDCREAMKAWPTAAADACITDPPYGDTSLEWDKRCAGWMAEVARVLRPAASVWVFGSMRYLSTIFAEMEAAGFRYAQDIVWEKHNGSGFHADRFRRVHEHAVQFYRGAWGQVFNAPQYTNDATARAVRRKGRPAHTGNIGAAHYVSQDGGPRLQRSVVYARSEHGRALHPTQKPLEVVALLIKTSVPPGGIVLDPFLGSGTTALAAEQLGARWAGCERDPHYLEVVDTRMKQIPIFTGGTAP